MSKQTDQLFDDEVSTGATLTSGTTVGGNEVYHLGNDGQGSGLDAEFVQGSAPIQTGVPYVRETVGESTGNQGAILSQFPSPSFSPRGIGLDAADSIWHADGFAVSIYQLDQSGATLSQFASPSSSPTGIGLDSSDSIWHADFSADSIYHIDSGTKLLGTKLTQL